MFHRNVPNQVVSPRCPRAGRKGTGTIQATRQAQLAYFHNWTICRAGEYRHRCLARRECFGGELGEPLLHCLMERTRMGDALVDRISDLGQLRRVR
jgi:hypothetical protein